MHLPVHVMEALLIAVGFTGALTLVWLARRAAGLLWPPPSVAGLLSPGGGCVEALVREIGAARREVLFQAHQLSCRPVAQALVDARLRGAGVEVLLGAADEEEGASDLAFLREQGLAPRVSDKPLSGPLVLIDDRDVVAATFPLAGTIDTEVVGQMFVIKGHPALARSCRRAFGEPVPAEEAPAAEAPAADTPPPAAVAAPAQPEPAPDPLEALARANVAAEGSEPPGPAVEKSLPPVTKAAADLLDRLRRETAAAEEEDGAEEKAA